MTAVVSPLTGVVVSINVAVGDHVRAGQTVAVLESMKMEHVVEAESDGVVASISAKEGDNLSPGDLLLDLAPTPAEVVSAQEQDLPVVTQLRLTRSFCA